jgi:hypothetical protein
MLQIRRAAFWTGKSDELVPAAYLLPASASLPGPKERISTTVYRIPPRPGRRAELRPTAEMKSCRSAGVFRILRRHQI